MNIIRTKAVELTSIPAIGYKLKLPGGGAGVKILRLDIDAHADATLDKRTGEAVPYGSFDEKLFPSEAFDEALELTAGMPYSLRGNIKLAVSGDAVKDGGDDGAKEAEPPIKINAMIDSDEYIAIAERYSDENGKMNYLLMNKDFIQFASKSKVVSDMVANKALAEDILIFIIKSRAALVANKKESLSDEDTKMLIETLDEIDPRSAFKELKHHVNRLLAKR